MRQQRFHLERMLVTKPGDDPRYMSLTHYWRDAMAQLGPLMEYLLLEQEAAQRGARWSQRLGERLVPIRARLPPVEPGAFERWDAQPLLQQLRAALGSERPVPREIPGATPPEGVCALAERGRLAAARAKLRGEKVAVRPRRTAALQAELQAKSPQPRDGLLTGEQFERNADEVAALVRDIDVADRITTDDLLRAARGVRGTAAPGPDGWTGGYLRRIATLFPRQVGELMQRDYNALATTHDALHVCAVTASTVAGLPKPQANDDDAALQPGVPAHRPIVIANVVARCILNLVTARAKPALRARRWSREVSSGCRGWLRHSCPR